MLTEVGLIRFVVLSAVALAIIVTACGGRTKSVNVDSLRHARGNDWLWFFSQDSATQDSITKEALRRHPHIPPGRLPESTLDSVSRLSKMLGYLLSSDSALWALDTNRHSNVSEGLRIPSSQIDIGLTNRDNGSTWYYVATEPRGNTRAGFVLVMYRDIHGGLEAGPIQKYRRNGDSISIEAELLYVRVFRSGLAQQPDAGWDYQPFQDRLHIEGTIKPKRIKGLNIDIASVERMPGKGP